MPLAEAMTTQRAVRRLKPDPVDDALVLRLIELALKAPSGVECPELGVHRRARSRREGQARALGPP
jgi:nitroreductase